MSQTSHRQHAIDNLTALGMLHRALTEARTYAGCAKATQTLAGIDSQIQACLVEMARAAENLGRPDDPWSEDHWALMETGAIQRQVEAARKLASPDAVRQAEAERERQDRDIATLFS